MTKYSITHAAMSFEHAVYAIFEHSGQAFVRVAMILGQIFCDRHGLNYWFFETYPAPWCQILSNWREFEQVYWRPKFGHLLKVRLLSGGDCPLGLGSGQCPEPKLKPSVSSTGTQ